MPNWMDGGALLCSMVPTSVLHTTRDFKAANPKAEEGEEGGDNN